MSEALLKLIISQGIFAVLFCFLLYYVLQENSKREGKYQDIIGKLTEKFETIEDGIKEIKEEIKTIIK